MTYVMEALKVIGLMAVLLIQFLLWLVWK